MLKKCLQISSNKKDNLLLATQANGIWSVDHSCSNESTEKLLSEKPYDFILLDLDSKLSLPDTKIPVFLLSRLIKKPPDDLKNLCGGFSLPYCFADLQSEVESKIKEFSKTYEGLCGKSRIIKKTKDFIDKAASNDLPVLISGETGCGKNLVAKLIHKNSKRKNRPFVEMNVASIPNTLIESTMFGVSKGAYTGAFNSAGVFETADGGTVFLDEIESMNLQLQAKLLSVVEQKKFRHLGEMKIRTSDFRILSATNAPLEKMIRKKLFRRDLYYRLNVLHLNMKPLREHPEDIKYMARYFLKKHSKTLTESALKKLEKHKWTGNVRELKNCLDRAAIFTKENLIKSKDIDLSIFEQDLKFKDFIK